MSESAPTARCETTPPPSDDIHPATPILPAGTSYSFYEQVVALERANTPFILVMLVEARGSVPQDAGAKMLVTSAGLHAGTVGGGRVEARAIAVAGEMLAAMGSPLSKPASEPRTPAPVAPTLVSWTLKGDVGMTCGGAVKLYFEPHPAGGATWTIAVFGAGHIAQALLAVLAPLPCVVACYDTRQDWVARLPQGRNVRSECREDLASAIDALPGDAFVVCMTQGHKTDRPILERALTARHFPFIGVIGSDAKAAILRRELIADGVDPRRVDQVQCPVGLPFGTNHPHEIALSIAAQLLTERDKLVPRRHASA